MSQWHGNLTLEQNCSNEMATLIALSEFNKTHCTSKPLEPNSPQGNIEKLAKFNFTLTFIKNRLKYAYNQIFKVQQNILTYQECSTHNRRSMLLFKTPLKKIELSLRKIRRIQTKNHLTPIGNKNVDQLETKLVSIVSRCKKRLCSFLHALHKYQNLLRFGHV